MSLLVQQPAPGFSAQAVMPDNSIKENFGLEESKGRYRILFFYPFDFSFVCPTELLALNDRLDEFQDRDCDVIGVSVDSVFSHLAWKKAVVDDGGIGPIAFPLVSDLEKTISRDYGVLSGNAVSLRATFLIDRDGVIRHMTVNDMDTGRSVRDLLRTLDAVRRFDQTGKFCPANWREMEGDRRVAAPSDLGLQKSVQTFDL